MTQVSNQAELENQNSSLRLTQSQHHKVPDLVQLKVFKTVIQEKFL